jgi:hypothetical protein
MAKKAVKWAQDNKRAYSPSLSPHNTQSFSFVSRLWTSVVKINRNALRLSFGGVAIKCPGVGTGRFPAHRHEKFPEISQVGLTYIRLKQLKS